MDKQWSEPPFWTQHSLAESIRGRTHDDSWNHLGCTFVSRWTSQRGGNAAWRIHVLGHRCAAGPGTDVVLLRYPSSLLPGIPAGQARQSLYLRALLDGVELPRRVFHPELAHLF